MKIFSTLFALGMLMLVSIGAIAQGPIFVQTTRLILPGGNGNGDKIERVADDRYVIATKSAGVAAAFIVNRFGVVQTSKSFGAMLGGIRSELTDVAVSNNNFIFVGDCDDCVPNHPGRQTIVIKTDRDLQNATWQHLPVPPGTLSTDKVFGYQKIRRTNDTIVVASALLNIVNGTDTSTNLFITRINDNLVANSSFLYDRYKFDNLGDLEFRDGRLHLLTWSIKYIGIGGDSSSLARIALDGTVEWEKRYQFFAQALSPVRNSTNWILGGARTSDFINGPQAMLARVDVNGNLQQSTTFGTTKIDMVWDVQPLDNNNILVAATFSQQYPEIIDVFENPNYLDFTQVGFPYSARIMRFNPTTLAQVSGSSALPNSQAQAVILRSVLPTNSTGTNFVSCGYVNNQVLFYAINPIGSTFGSGTNRPERSNPFGPVTGDDNAFASVYPNPVQAGAPLWLNDSEGMEFPVNVTMMDVSGRIVMQQQLNETMFNVPSGLNAGMYFVTVQQAGKAPQTARLQIGE